MALKDRAVMKFPARVLAEAGLAVERENGVYRFSLDFGSLSEVDTIPDDSAAYLVVLTPGETEDDPDVLETVSVETFLNETNAVNQDRQIISGAGLTGGGDLSADRTLAVGAGTGIAVAADAVALAPIDARAIMVNNTAGSAAPTGVEISTLTTKASPAVGDYVMISDQAAGGALKKATVAAVGSAGAVSSLNTLTGDLVWSVVVQTFTASGTYTPTSGMKYAVIECVGGGGGGGGATSSGTNACSGGGGGSGSYARKRVTAADVGASKTVTIGAGGAGGSAGANNGSAGGDTSVGSLCIGKGGGAGGGGGTGALPGTGGAGGVAGTGDFTPVGAPGGVAATVTTATGTAGACGGSSVFGGGARGNVVASASGVNGNNASNYGSGGGGGLSFGAGGNGAGGNGSDGVVIITEYVIA